jgi:O-antigen ligase
MKPRWSAYYSLPGAAGQQVDDAAWRERLLWLSSPRGGELQLMALAVLVMGLSLVMSQSRSGVICFTLAMAAGAVAGRRRYRSNAARLGIVGALTLLLVLSVVCSDVRVSDRFALRVDDSIRLRQDIWSVTARIIRDFPLTGTGLNTYGTATLAYQVSHLDMHYAEAHNDYLQLAAEGGVLLSAPVLAPGWSSREPVGETLWPAPAALSKCPPNSGNTACGRARPLSSAASQPFGRKWSIPYQTAAEPSAPFAR